MVGKRSCHEHCVIFVLCVLMEQITCGETKQFQGSKNGESLALHKRATDVSSAEYIYNRNKEAYKSEATYYGEYPGGGACTLDPLSPMASQSGWIRVAANNDDFKNSLGCGMCVEITGSGKGSGSNPVTGVTKAIVHDLCGGCGKGGYDLYIPGDGRWEIESKAIDCPTVPGKNGNLMFRFVDKNLWSFKLQVRNHKVPVAGIEVVKNGKYYCLKRTSDNYFTGDGLGKVELPLKVRVTAVTGEQREAVLPSMSVSDILTDEQFSGFAAGPGPSSIKCAGQGNKPPYPPGGMAPGGGGGGLGPPPSPPPPSPAPSPVPTGGGGGITASGTASGGGAAGSDFCRNRKGGLYLDPDDCAGFIICNIGKAHRQKCAPPQLFRADSKNCDLPDRVDCGSRPRLYGDKRSDHNGYMKPSVAAASQGGGGGGLGPGYAPQPPHPPPAPSPVPTEGVGVGVGGRITASGTTSGGGAGKTEDQEVPSSSTTKEIITLRLDQRGKAKKHHLKLIQID